MRVRRRCALWQITLTTCYLWMRRSDLVPGDLDLMVKVTGDKKSEKKCGILFVGHRASTPVGKSAHAV